MVAISVVPKFWRILRGSWTLWQTFDPIILTERKRGSRNLVSLHVANWVWDGVALSQGGLLYKVKRKGYPEEPSIPKDQPEAQSKGSWPQIVQDSFAKVKLS